MHIFKYRTENILHTSVEENEYIKYLIKQIKITYLADELN